MSSWQHHQHPSFDLWAISALNVPRLSSQSQAIGITYVYSKVPVCSSNTVCFIRMGFNNLGHLVSRTPLPSQSCRTSGSSHPRLVKSSQPHILPVLWGACHSIMASISDIVRSSNSPNQGMSSIGKHFVLRIPDRLHIRVTQSMKRPVPLPKPYFLAANFLISKPSLFNHELVNFGLSHLV